MKIAKIHNVSRQWYGHSILFFLLCVCLSLNSCTVYNPFLKFEGDEKYVLLTFDDGPNNHKNVTREVLAVLKKHNVKALFNVIGANVDRYPDITKEIFDQGHLIANHGYTVKPVIFRRTKTIAWEIDSSTTALQYALDDSLFNPTTFRPSMGWINPRTKKLIKERGMKINGLTAYAFDTRRSAKAKHKITKSLVKSVIKHKGGVPVIHDGIAEYYHLEKRVAQGWKNYDRGFIPEVTDSVITILKREGFQFPRLDDDPPNDLTQREYQFFKKVIY